VLRDEEVNFRGAVTRAPWWALLGSVGTIAGVALCFTEAWTVGIMFALLGGSVALANMWWFAAKPVRLSANDRGVWFGGGKRIPWRDIRSIKLHVVSLPEAGHLVLAFRFCDPERALPRLPWWLRVREAQAGHLDFGPAAFERDLPAIAALLVALRARSAKPQEPPALVHDKAHDPRERRHITEQKQRPA